MPVKLADAVGNPRGRNADKNHRVAKLMKDWDSVKTKLENMVRRGGCRTDASLNAYAVLLIMHTGIRVGNEESAEGFVSVGQRVKDGKVVWQSETHGQLCKTYGLTTLRGRHVNWSAKLLRLRFVGKKHVAQDLLVTCPLMIKYAPDHDGDPDVLWLGVTDRGLRKFVRRYVGRAFVPKDIRRAYVNRLFLTNFFAGAPDAAGEFQAAKKKSDRNKVVRAVIEETAATVGHTPGVCRSAYLSHPMLEVLKQWTPDHGPIV